MNAFIEPEIRAAERGKAQAGSAHWRYLQLAREVARELCAGGRVTNGDEVRAELARRWPDMLEGNLNWLGAVWTKEFRSVGFLRSRTPGSHGNRLLLWTLRGTK